MDKKKSTKKNKTKNEMYQEYIDSLNILAPTLKDYHLTERIIDYINNPQKLNEINCKKYQDTINSEKWCLRKKWKKKNFWSSFIASIILTTIISYHIIKIDKFMTLLVIPILFLLTLTLHEIIDFFYPTFEKSHIKKFTPEVKYITITDSDIGRYHDYLKEKEQFDDMIKNLKIQIPWKNVTFLNGQISCFVSIFQKSFVWKIDKSISDYDKYRVILMEKFPDLFFQYGDGHLYLYTGTVDKAITVIIKYIEKETAEIKAKEEKERKEREERDRIKREQEEKERKEREEREKEQEEKERKEREKREQEERERREQEEKECKERERKEKEKLMNDFYNSHPYFKNEHDKQDILRNRIKVEKSMYLNYLVERQLEGIDIMSVEEDRRAASMSEWNSPEIQKGYVFIIKMNAIDYCLIYENVFDNNASIKYINSSLSACLEAAMDIKLHMQSKTPNKRDKIASTRRIGAHRVRRIMHDDYYVWKQKVHSKTFR